jgi:hypothetical protein
MHQGLMKGLWSVSIKKVLWIGYTLHNCYKSSVKLCIVFIMSIIESWSEQDELGMLSVSTPQCVLFVDASGIMTFLPFS